MSETMSESNFINNCFVLLRICINTTDNMVSPRYEEKFKKLGDNKPQLDVFGTPMPVKSPINFEARLVEQKESTRAAKKKLLTVSIVSIFFITA